MSLKHDFRQTVVIANIRLPGNHAPVGRDCLNWVKQTLQWFLLTEILTHDTNSC